VQNRRHDHMKFTNCSYNTTTSHCMRLGAHIGGPGFEPLYPPSLELPLRGSV